MRGAEQFVKRCSAIAAAALILLLAAVAAYAAPAAQLTVEEMKSRLSSTSVGDKPHLCLAIAERQLEATDKLYNAAQIEQAQSTLTDVVAYSELARDYAVQSHKHQKQTEIAVRNMARRLADIEHLVTHDEEEPIQAAIKRLQHVRDDLLMAMFPKGKQ
jgi:hypothetical protein